MLVFEEVAFFEIGAPENMIGDRFIKGIVLFPEPGTGFQLCPGLLAVQLLYLPVPAVYEPAINRYGHSERPGIGAQAFVILIRYSLLIDRVARSALYVTHIIIHQHRRVHGWYPGDLKMLDLVQPYRRASPDAGQLRQLVCEVKETLTAADGPVAIQLYLPDADMVTVADAADQLPGVPGEAVQGERSVFHHRIPDKYNRDDLRSGRRCLAVECDDCLGHRPGCALLLYDIDVEIPDIQALYFINIQELLLVIREPELCLPVIEADLRLSGRSGGIAAPAHQAGQPAQDDISYITRAHAGIVLC